MEVRGKQALKKKMKKFKMVANTALGCRWRVYSSYQKVEKEL